MTTPTIPVGDWRPQLDLSEPGLRRFDATRVPKAVKAGREAGYEAGRAEAAQAGRDAIERERQQAHAAGQAMVAAIGAAAASLDQIESTAAEQFASIVIDTALELAEAILHRELHEPTVRAAEAARRALSLLDRHEGVDLQLHPEDAAALHGLELPDGVRVVANPSIERGDAIALTADASIDARISSALARARRALEGTE